MIKRLIAGIAVLCVLLAAGCSRPAQAPAAPSLEASEIRKVEFKARSLDDQAMKINVYLPKGYTTAKQYPVLYLYHGHGGSEESWPKMGVKETADAMTEAGKIPPLIIAMPAYGNSYGINTYRKPQTVPNPTDPSRPTHLGLYEDYLVKDVVEHIDQSFATIRSRESRWVGGHSMGGYASIHAAFLHPDLFSRVGSHSGAIITDDTWPNPAMKDWLYPENLRAERDPVMIAQKRDLKSLQVYMDIGKDDSYRFFVGMEQLQKALTERGVKSQYHLNEGKHDGAYVRAHLEEYLLFYTGAGAAK